MYSCFIGFFTIAAKVFAPSSAWSCSVAPGQRQWRQTVQRVPGRTPYLYTVSLRVRCPCLATVPTDANDSDSLRVERTHLA